MNKPLNKIIIAVVLLVVVLGAGVGGTLWWKAEQERRWKWQPILLPERLARVTDTWSATTLAERLQKTKKIRDRDTFLEAARQVGLTHVAPGAYVLPKIAGPLELAKIFKEPPALVKITFPEGWTGHQMARRLAANKFVAATTFERLIYPPGQAVSPWEGALYPDTYYLPPRGTAQQLFNKLHDPYKAVVASLPRPFPFSAGHRLTQQEVTTLASLVERETDTPGERPLVAGVLLHRLQIHMRLQCDASVQYAMELAAAAGVPGVEGHKNRVLWRDLKLPSPYNTYLNSGLPPGPICNPSAASLRAAAAPRTTDYLFYVMSPLLGHHRFAKTFAEHEHNIKLARAEQKQ